MIREKKPGELSGSTACAACAVCVVFAEEAPGVGVTAGGASAAAAAASAAIFLDSSIRADDGPLSAAGAGDEVAVS